MNAFVITKIYIFTLTQVEKMIIRVEKSILILLAAFLTLVNSNAQVLLSDIYTSKQISSSNGLPYDYVDDIHVDDNGFAWFSLYGGGLARYDGDSFTTITEKSPIPIASDYVTMCAHDRNKRLWVSTKKGIDLIDIASMEVLPLPSSIHRATSGKFCNCVIHDACGNIWFHAGESIFRATFAEDGSISALDSLSLNTRLSEDYKPAISSYTIKDLDNDGTVYLAYGSGLYKVSALQERGLKLDIVSQDLDFGRDNHVFDYLKQGNNIWIATEQGLFRLDISSGRWKQYCHDSQNPRSIASDRITSLALSYESQVLVGTLRGINVYDPISDSFDHYSTDLDKYGNRCLFSNYVNCISLVGKDIWIGSEIDGITVLKHKHLNVTNVKPHSYGMNPFPNGPVRDIMFDTSGRMWLGMEQNGLFVSGVYQDDFRELSLTSISEGQNTVCDIEMDSAGDVWIGTHGGGIEAVRLERNRTISSRRIQPFSDSYYSNYITCLKYDKYNDYMWIATEEGIFCYDLTHDEYMPQLYNITKCSCLFIDSSERLWAGARDGTEIIDLHSLTVTQPLNAPKNVTCITEGTDGSIFLGTDGHGLFKYVSGSIEKVDIAGLDDERMKGMLVNNDAIWISSENGIIQLENSSIRSYSISDGLENTRFCKNCACIGPEGNMFFGHQAGYSILYPTSLPSEADPRNLILHTVLCSGTSSNLLYHDRIKFHERDRSISFMFSDLSFDGPTGVTYQYRLLPKESEWKSLVKPQKTVDFSNIPKGRHVLQIRAVDRSGKTVGETSLNVTVIPFFYKTVWFILFIALLAALIIHFVTYSRTKILKNREEELKKEIDKHVRLLSIQKKALEIKAEELSRQNKVLIMQNEELARHKILFNVNFKQSHDSIDSQFVNKVMKVLQDMYKDSTLDISSFCSAIGMSRSMLNIKMNETFGMPISQFIRTYRLSVAKEILSHNKDNLTINIADVAYDVGFNDPKYFSKCFSKEYGYPPSSIASSDGSATG